MSNEQYLGESFDGAYFSLNVPELLDEYFGFNANSKPHDWDPLHKADLQDVHLRKEKICSWLVLHTATISSIFRLVNYGKEFEHLLDIAKDMNESLNLEIEFKLPAFFSVTRFANSVKKVYSNFREDYPALIRLLEEIQINKFQGSSTERQKAMEASEL